jgi:hypothetical protein
MDGSFKKYIQNVKTENLEDLGTDGRIMLNKNGGRLL